MKPIPWILAGTLPALLFSAPILACTCLEGGPALRFNGAQAVFIGQMQEGTEQFKLPPNDDGRLISVEAGSVRFTVEESFKGSLGEEVTVEVASSRGNSCGPYGLRRGVQYLIYAFRAEAEPKKLYSGVCSGSRPLDTESARADLQFLRDLPPLGTGGSLVGSVSENLRWQGRRSFPNFTVQLRNREGKIIEVVTDQEGRFEFTGLAPGRYLVEPKFPADYAGESAKIAEVNIEDRGTAGVNIEAYINGRVYGRLLDREGRGYNRAFLLMEPDGGAPSDLLNGAFSGYQSGGQGAFQFRGVPAGRYRMFLLVRHADYTDQPYYYPGTFERSQAAVIAVGRAEAVSDLEYRLPEGFLVRTVDGQVVSPDGKPVAKAAVGFMCVDRLNTKRGVLESNVVYDAYTGTDGRFRLEAIAGTTYWLQARAYSRPRVHSPGTLLTVATDLRNVKLVLSEPGEAGGCKAFRDQLAGPSAPVTKPKPEEVAGLIAEARQHLAEDRLIDGPPGSDARDTLLRLRLLVPQPPEVKNLSRLLSDRLLDYGRKAMRATAYERSAQLLRAAREMAPGSDEAALAQAEAELKTLRKETGL